MANFAARLKYIVTDLAVEISEIPGPKKQPAAICIYSPRPITDNLAAWLAPYVQAFGPVNPATEEVGWVVCCEPSSSSVLSS